MINRILRQALRTRGRDDPALICHIGFSSPERVIGKLKLVARDRMVDLDQVPADTPLDPPGTESLPIDAGRPQVGLTVVVARTPTDLRRAVTLGERLPDAVQVIVTIAEMPPHWGPPLPLAPGQGQWRNLEDMHARRHLAGGWTLELYFLEAVPAGEVVAAIARSLGGGRRGSAAAPNPLVALAGSDSTFWRPGDVGATGAPEEGPVRTLRVTPASDLALRSTGHPPREWTDERVHPVDRKDFAAASWQRYGGPGEGSGNSGDGAAHPATPDDVAPIDERVVNPIGFTRETKPVIAKLAQRTDRWVITQGNRELVEVPGTGTITDVDLHRLRHLRALEVEWGGQPGPAAAVRAVAGLAAGGIPLISGVVPEWAGAMGAELRGLLTSADADDLGDDLTREEHSVRLRRCALRTHGSLARWRRIGDRLGVPRAPDPLVSVIMCTRRPDMVGFALRQIVRQRLVEHELVLTLHGFTADLPEVAAAIAQYRESGRPVTVFEADAGTRYGLVLNQAVARCSGDFIAKMDDDDWYGPEHLADMHLARVYAGAEVVGCGQEFTYLEELGLTARRGSVTEKAVRHISGGTLFMDRVVLEEVGGFRPLPRAIDSQMLTAVTKNGGRIYRTHGLGYVLRRKAEGHTWSEDAGYFLRGKNRQWSGWRPSALLESDPRDEPTHIPDELEGATG